MKRKTITILGMGIFGSTLAKKLSRYNMDVIAVDRNMKNIEAVSDYVSNALCLDFTDIDDLKAAGIADSDIGIVCTSERLEDAVLGVVNLKQIGVPLVYAKANTNTITDVLYKVGADRVITPEKEVADNLAKKIVSENVLELLDIDDKNTIYDIRMPESWVGKSLVELSLRNKYGVNVIGIRRNGEIEIRIDPNEKLNEEDDILIIGKSDLFKNDHFFD